MNNDQLWQAVLGELELAISKANFTTWFRNTFITSYDGVEVVIAVPNTFTKAWLENKYHATIVKALNNITKSGVRTVAYRVENGAPSTKPSLAAQETMRSATQAATASETTHGLNPKYTFESFVVGKGNELARAASLAVAAKPGLAYNPLFLYGGVGLGKTHLMQAIGHTILRQQQNIKVLYVTCERFTNSFIHAVTRGEASEFKQLFRSVDVLLIDDIQFLAGKEGTQEEFFHTFNALHQNNKQIVITCDRPPKAIPALEHRLTSRFEWGMIADIGQPDLETRMAILKQKMGERGREYSPEVVQYIATHVQSNVRELEGALNRITAYHELNNTTPTVESTQDILSSLLSQPKRRALTPRQLLAVVADFFDITIDDLTGVSRKRELVVPRQITMYLLREEIKCSYPNIGQELGGRDHTTAMHAYTKITQEIEANEKVRQDVHLLRQRLYASSA
ncbi:MAG: chromosomal replication initiator protein DnaA [Candidatus Kerfeldbacteria bacterium]|nr:chromosomal replication initiator protein DnaA [Candidatus Kerfeldbacteria bacterium]